MPIKKKKKKIIKLSTSKKQQRGLKNFSHGGFEKNPFIEAAKVKNYKQLKEFVELHTPALGPAGVAYAATEFVFKNYNTMKIARDPDCYNSIMFLLDGIDQTKGGAKKVYNDYLKTKAGLLHYFIKETGYVPAPSATEFQAHLTKIKEVLGIKRKKKIVPHFREPKKII